MKKIFVFLLVLFTGVAAPAFAGEVKIIDKDALKAMIGSADLVVFDVRTGKDWSSSEFKIKDAVRLTSENIDAVMRSVAKDKKLVFYCA